MFSCISCFIVTFPSFHLIPLCSLVPFLRSHYHVFSQIASILVFLLIRFTIFRLSLSLSLSDLSNPQIFLSVLLPLLSLVTLYILITCMVIPPQGSLPPLAHSFHSSSVFCPSLNDLTSSFILYNLSIVKKSNRYTYVS